MRKNSIWLILLLLAGCEEDVQNSTESTPQRSGITVETAYPSLKSETISLGGSGESEIAIEKRGDHYVWMGDIVLSEHQVDILSKSAKGEGRTALETINTLWTTGTVYYKINSSLPNTARVTDAIAHWQNVAPFIRFIVRTNQTNYIEFVSGSGCSSNLGMIGGRQEIVLGTDCTSGNAIHEIGHALGLLHEHIRADRDATIIVNTGNIQSDKLINFNIYTDSGMDGFEIGTLDFNSIMMYPSFTGFEINTAIPAITRLNGTTFTAQRVALSAGDIEIINILYGPPFASLHGTIVADYTDGDVQITETEFFIRFWQDRNGTIPMNLPIATTVNYAFRQYWTYPSQNPITFNNHLTLAAGSNTYSLGVVTTSRCAYNYMGEVIGECYSIAPYFYDGLGYTNL